MKESASQPWWECCVRGLEEKFRAHSEALMKDWINNTAPESTSIKLWKLINDSVLKSDSEALGLECEELLEKLNQFISFLFIL